MKIKYQFFPEDSLLMIKFSQTLSADSLPEILKILSRDTSFSTTTKYFVDLREVQHIEDNNSFLPRFETYYAPYKISFLVSLYDPDIDVREEIRPYLEHVNQKYYRFGSGIGSLSFHLGLSYPYDIEKFASLNKTVQV